VEGDVALKFGVEIGWGPTAWRYDVRAPVMPAPVSFLNAALPIAVLAVLIVYGLMLRPLVFSQPSMPLKVRSRWRPRLPLRI
jgi:hypothetical protein